MANFNHMLVTNVSMCLNGIIACKHHREHSWFLQQTGTWWFISRFFDVLLIDQNLCSMANSDVNWRWGGNSIWAEETLSVHSWNFFCGVDQKQIALLVICFKQFWNQHFSVFLRAGFSDIKEPGKIIGPRCCAFVKSCAIGFVWKWCDHCS